MQDKPVKRGYKVWMLCDSSGYNLKYEVYTCKKEGKYVPRVGKQKSCCIHGQFFRVIFFMKNC